MSVTIRFCGAALLVGFQAQGTLGRFLGDGAKSVRIQGDEIKVAARIRHIDEYSGHADGPELARWITARRPISRGVFLVHGEEPALVGLSDRIAERIVPSARIFVPILEDIYELETLAPTPIDVAHRRPLAPEAVVSLDWHNDMSRLILDINDRIDAAADDRARGIISEIAAPRSIRSNESRLSRKGPLEVNGRRLAGLERS
jgi:metallo-beta-lactamase family protein